jgi:two-component system, sensor histidine kinase and response regulator
MAKKILMIEDDPIILKQTIHILKLEGFDALGADNGLTGLQLAQQHIPDLILSDISMPGMDGRQLLIEIRNDPRTTAIPFVFLTAQSNMSDLRLGMEMGADDYLTKPFSIPDLIAAVNTRLERHAAIIREQEKRMDELRSNLVFMLPHELRTPLMAILGYSDFLLGGIDDLPQAKVLEIVGSIRRGGERLHHLVENYLIYAQIELMKSDPKQLAQLRERPVLGPHVIIEQQAQRRASKLKRSHDLTCNIQKVPAIQVLEDSLIKIVDELVDNALKFSKDGSPVTVSASIEGEQGEYYVLQVSDCGRGMTEQQISDIGIYMQFQRKLYEQQGLGLGLSIVNGLLGLFDGVLKIESRIDEGTSVSVYLRIAEPIIDDRD